LTRRLLPAAVNWTLIVYALVLCAGIWVYTLQRIQSDYRATLEMEREHLRSVSATFEAQVEAMLGDGVGAALAAANEYENPRDLAAASDAQLSETLRHMLTGGSYVRSLFLATGRRFVRVGPFAGSETRTAPPEWLLPALKLKSVDAWAGGRISDPENPAEIVIPMARRFGQNTWAGALIAFASLDGVYQQPESASGVGLVSSDGTVLLLSEARVHSNEGSNVSSSELFRRMSRGPDFGTLEGDSPFARMQTIVAYNHVSGYPIWDVAWRRRLETFTAWDGRRRTTLLMAGGITLLVIVTTWLLNHVLWQLRRRELHYRALFNNAAFGAFVQEGEHIVEANRTSATMFGVGSPNELIGKRMWDLAPAIQPDGASSEVLCRERIGRAVTTGADSFEWTQQRLDTGAQLSAAADLSSLDADGKTLTLAVIHTSASAS